MTSLCVKRFEWSKGFDTAQYNKNIPHNLYPSISSLDVSARYFGGTMMLLSFATYMSVFVVNAHYRGTQGTRPSPLVRRIFLGFFGRLFGEMPVHSTTMSIWSEDEVGDLFTDLPTNIPFYNNIQYGTMQYNAIRYDPMRRDTARHGTTRHGTERHDTARYDTTRHDREQ